MPALPDVEGEMSGSALHLGDLPARFALVVEIDAGEMQVELYAEVQAAVVAMTGIEV